MNPQEIADGSLILCPRESQGLFLAFRRQYPRKSFTLLTLEELEELFDYGYDDRALCYLIKKGIGYSLAKEELKWIAKLKGSSYKSRKLNELLSLQKELLSQGLLYPHVAPERTILNRQILIYGYADGERLADLIDPYPSMNILYLPSEGERVSKRNVYGYEDAYFELRRLMNEICHDIATGTKPDDIFILGADSSYYGPLRDYAKFYGVAVETPREGRLYDEPVYRRFHSLCKEKGLEEALEELGKDFGTLPDYATIYRFAKRFARVGPDDLSLYDDIARASTPSTPRLTNAIHLTNSYYPRPSQHIYMINCALGVYPSTHGDDDFLSDVEKDEAGFPSSAETNRKSLAELDALLLDPSLRFLTYRERTSDGVCFPAPFISDRGYSLLENEESPYEYSKEKGAFYLASLLDKQRDYSYVDPSLSFLQSNIASTYDTYSYAFSSFEAVKADAPLEYSYTSLNLFNECPFHYYIEKVLGLSIYEDNFKASLGTIFHGVLEKSLKAGFSFEKAWGEEVQDIDSKTPFSPKEKALLNADKPFCEAVVSYHKEHFAKMQNPRFSPEKPFKTLLSGHPLITIKGRIDLAITTGSSYLTLIDYKTSDSHYVKQSLMQFGFSLQLPFYAYACQQDPSFQGTTLLGLWIADILPSGFTKEEPNMESVISKVYPMRGLFLSDADALKTFDPDFALKTYITGFNYDEAKGFNVKKNSIAPFMNEADLLAMGDKARDSILSADALIRSNDFKIEPKYLKGQIDSCKYCPFRCVCFRKEKDVKRLVKEEGQDGDGEEEDDE